VPRKYAIFLVVTALLVGLDQWTKNLVTTHITYRTEEIQLINGFLSLVHAQNKGAAGGFLGGFEHRMIVFGVFTVIALGVLGHMLWELPANDRFQTTALALITSGAVGNAIDRIDKQSVTDFVRVYTEHPTLKPWLIDMVGMAEWPSFNVADAAIVVGLALFFIHFLFMEKDDKKLAADPPATPIDEPGAQGPTANTAV
jgi:signal peptidase II